MCSGLAVQQRRCMVPAPRLQIKDAQGEERDVLQGLLSLQDAEVALPLDPSGAPCRLSRCRSHLLTSSPLLMIRLAVCCTRTEVCS